MHAYTCVKRYINQLALDKAEFGKEQPRSRNAWEELSMLWEGPVLKEGSLPLGEGLAAQEAEL